MEDHNLQDSLAAPITKMAVSPDGRQDTADSLRSETCHRP